MEEETQNMCGRGRAEWHSSENDAMDLLECQNDLTAHY